MSILIASRFRAVSTSVSPFVTEDPLAPMLTVSALERRFSANSKETRVRVEASKKRLTMVLPRSDGDLLDAALRDLFEGLGGVQDGDGSAPACQTLEPDEVLAHGR